MYFFRLVLWILGEYYGMICDKGYRGINMVIMAKIEVNMAIMTKYDN